MTPTKDETAGGRGGNGDGLPGSTVDACVEGVLGSITARQGPDAPAGDPSKCSSVAWIVIESSKGPTVVVGARLYGKPGISALDRTGSGGIMRLSGLGVLPKAPPSV